MVPKERFNKISIHGTPQMAVDKEAICLSRVLFFFIFSNCYVGSMCLMRRLHLGRSCASSSDNPPLRQVVPDAIQPPPLWSSSPSFPRHLHPHHSLPYVFVFSSRNMPIPLQPTLLHFVGYFSHFCRPSNSFIPNSVHLGDSTHPS